MLMTNETGLTQIPNDMSGCRVSTEMKVSIRENKKSSDPYQG